MDELLVFIFLQFAQIQVEFRFYFDLIRVNLFALLLLDRLELLHLLLCGAWLELLKVHGRRIIALLLLLLVDFSVYLSQLLAKTSCGTIQIITIVSCAVLIVVVVNVLVLITPFVGM